MRVCVIAGREFFHPFDQRLYKEMTALSNAGFEVTLVTPDKEGGTTTVDDIPVIKVSTKGRGTIAKKMVAACKDVRCDIYHAHEYDGGYIGASLKVLTGRKVIYDVHDEVPALKAELKKNPKLEKLYDPIERQVIKAMDGIVLAEDSYRERYDKLHKQTVVIHNYPMLELFRCSTLDSNSVLKPPLKETADRLMDKFVVGYVGGLSIRRGLEVMLEAMNELKGDNNICLLLIGDLDRDPDRKLFKEKIDEYALKDRVVVTGWVEYRNMPSYLELMDVGLVLVQPLRRLMGITPTKLFEYMACGKPVIGSNLPGIEKIITETHAGLLIEHDDSGSLAEAVRKLHDSAELCRKMGNDGYNAVRDKYNWEMEGKKLVEFYKKFG